MRGWVTEDESEVSSDQRGEMDEELRVHGRTVSTRMPATFDLVGPDPMRPDTPCGAGDWDGGAGDGGAGDRDEDGAGWEKDKTSSSSWDKQRR